MRYVTIPAPVRIESINLDFGKLPNYAAQTSTSTMLVDFVFLVREVWLNDQAFAKAKEMRMASAIDAKFESAEPGDEVALEDAEWKILSDVVESSQHQPRWMKRAMQMLDAVLEASKKPTKATNTIAAVPAVAPEAS